MNMQLPITSIVAFLTGLVGVLIGLSLQAFGLYPLRFILELI